MQSKNVDIELTNSILNRLNSGNFSSEPTAVSAIPKPDDQAIIDCSGSLSYSISGARAASNLSSIGSPVNPEDFAATSGKDLFFDQSGLRKLGLALSPLLSYGVLNGGSASSYADRKKNSEFDSDLFAYYSEIFDSFSDKLRGMPKGLTPAFIQPDKNAGPTFMELKMRGLLAGGRSAKDLVPDSSRLAPYLPAYQMTSASNNDMIARAYEEYRKSPLLSRLNGAGVADVTEVESAMQPLITAYSKKEGKWSIFSEAFGKESSVLPLPGGHGQCFVTLKPVFERLHALGKRFVILGNVDNLGNMPKPEYLAILALSGAPAGFEFSYRTPVDVKGGVLVRDENGRLTCADIGPAIRQEDVLDAERQGAKILFNCATGLFDLDYLVNNIDDIIASIPLRVSKQEKDAGVYYQAEQITWEIISLLDNPMIFGVRKNERFLAAKLFIENLLTSGIGLEDPDFPAAEELKKTALLIHNGLNDLLKSVYGMRYDSGLWKPDE